MTDPTDNSGQAALDLMRTGEATIIVGSPAHAEWLAAAPLRDYLNGVLAEGLAHRMFTEAPMPPVPELYARHTHNQTPCQSCEHPRIHHLSPSSAALFRSGTSCARPGCDCASFTPNEPVEGADVA